MFLQAENNISANALQDWINEREGTIFKITYQTPLAICTNAGV